MLSAPSPERPSAASFTCKPLHRKKSEQGQPFSSGAAAARSAGRGHLRILNERELQSFGGFNYPKTTTLSFWRGRR